MVDLGLTADQQTCKPDPGKYGLLSSSVGDPASGAYPAEMLIDWVRVF
jgi:hypothetical protein